MTKILNETRYRAWFRIFDGPQAGTPTLIRIQTLDIPICIKGHTDFVGAGKRVPVLNAGP